tara:strand:+ start:45 stop:362 length:318 start_codon:yes stop_codon:yes gene_type:complete
MLYKIKWGEFNASLNIGTDRAHLTGNYDLVKMLKRYASVNGYSWPNADKTFADLIGTRYDMEISVESGEPKAEESVEVEEPKVEEAEEPKKNTYSSKKRGKYRDG